MKIFSLNTSNLIKYSVVFAILTTVLTGALLTVSPQSAYADYQGDRLIDDSIFLDANSMDAGQIQSFLDSKSGVLKSRNFVLDCDAAGATAKAAYQWIGAPCGASIPASRIIFYSSRIYGVNPKVILATLQKEQSLITNATPAAWNINQAMGYACPTTGACNDNSGFFWQVDNGAWALRYHYERAHGNNTWWNNGGFTCGNPTQFYKPGLWPGTNVTFYDGNSAPYRTFLIANASTAAFYCYTPHTYNNPSGAFGLPTYGSTGIYYSGWYHFVYFYEIWFGPSIDTKTVGFGNVTDTPIVGNWDGSGKTNAGVWRAGVFYLRKSNGSFETIPFGNATDTPIAGYWDGGKTSVGVWRAGVFYLRKSNGSFETIPFGNATDTPIVGSWDGGSRTSVGVWRAGVFYLRKSNGSFETIPFGNATDKPVAGHWDTSGRANIGVWRAGVFYLRKSNGSYVSVPFGNATDTPFAGHWDGNEKTNVGVWRAGVFYFL